MRHRESRCVVNARAARCGWPGDRGQRVSGQALRLRLAAEKRSHITPKPVRAECRFFERARKIDLKCWRQKEMKIRNGCNSVALLLMGCSDAGPGEHPRNQQGNHRSLRNRDR